MRIGYARVSTPDQDAGRQIDALHAAGCERVYSETASGGRGRPRPEWDACRRALRSGDELVVTELSRLGRNAGDVCRLADSLSDEGIGLVVLGLGLDVSTPTGRLVVAMLAAVAEMERELLVERTRSGLAAAKARGHMPGRPPKVRPRDIRRALELIESGATTGEAARAIGVSRATLYRHLGRTEHKADFDLARERRGEQFLDEKLRRALTAAA